jgi:hypothetical protein
MIISRCVFNQLLLLDDENPGATFVTAIPGYTGHIPGAISEGRYGASKHRLNWESYLQSGKMPESVRPGNMRGTKYRPGLDVVGYTGYVPGKHAGNVFAKTFSEANFASQKLKRKQMELMPPSHEAYVEKILRRFEQISPSNVSGNFGMYCASQDASAHA